MRYDAHNGAPQSWKWWWRKWASDDMRDTAILVARIYTHQWSAKLWVRVCCDCDAIDSIHAFPCGELRVAWRAKRKRETASLNNMRQPVVCGAQSLTSSTILAYSHAHNTHHTRILAIFAILIILTILTMLTMLTILTISMLISSEGAARWIFNEQHPFTFWVIVQLLFACLILSPHTHTHTCTRSWLIQVPSQWAPPNNSFLSLSNVRVRRQQLLFFWHCARLRESTLSSQWQTRSQTQLETRSFREREREWELAQRELSQYHLSI